MLEVLNRGTADIESIPIFLIRATGISGGKPPPAPEVTKISPLCNSANKGVNINFNSELFVPVKIPRSRLLADTTGILELISVMSETRA